MDSPRTAVRPLGGRLDARTTCDTGRRARLELEFAVRRGRTVIVHAYAEPPFRVGRAFQADDGLHLVMAWSAPGIFGGDTFEQLITVGSGARVRLTSQSAMQAHPAPHGETAAIFSRYRVESDGHLRCEWDPTIPFQGANLDQRNHLSLAEGASLFWSDALMAGREARGERWALERLANELILTRAGSLDYLERYEIRPALHAVDTPWMAGDASYFGTTLIVGRSASRAAAEALHAALGEVQGVRAAADVLAEHLLLVRLMASSGVPFHEARAVVNDVVSKGLSVRD